MLESIALIVPVESKQAAEIVVVELTVIALEYPVELAVGDEPSVV